MSLPEINFLDPNLQRRGQRRELLARACAITHTNKPKIIDTTAGLGRDAYLLASLGCPVIGLERHPEIAKLLQQALSELKQQNPEFPLEIIHADANIYLKNLKAKPDIIYLDPMHPERKKSALVKKPMRILRSLVGTDSDSGDLLLLALQSANKRILVKRPLKSGYLNHIKPHAQYLGKTVRFDYYLPQPGEQALSPGDSAQ